MQNVFIFFVSFLLSMSSYGHENELNVLNYELSIEPNIQQNALSGSVEIKFQLPLSESTLVLSAGNLLIETVNGDHVESFTTSGNKLTINLSQKRDFTDVFTIHFSGNPKKGLLFDQENNQAYTMFFTEHWMVSNPFPSDKATLSINILVEKGVDCISNGELIEILEEKGKYLYRWRQEFESPTYTYGFVIGTFNKAEERYHEKRLAYYSQHYSSKQLQIIFKETPSMISFFEEKSGIEFQSNSYSQILIGDHYQEMSALSVLKDTYGNFVLEDSTETNLISHELAHQWWGNRITCKNWNHFWLNEAMATYMSAAYNEYRFGQYKYNSDINSYFNVYQDVKKRKNDKPLVFENWSNPSKDDRNIVYFKGAYVLHLLRDELGDDTFWKAIRFYSTNYFGESVETKDFQKALEESSGINLDDFFNEWVY